MDNDIVNKFTTHLKNVLTRALCFAVQVGQTEVQPEHLLWAVATQKGCIAAEVLRKHNVDRDAIRHLVGATIDEPLNASDLTPMLSDQTKRIIERAVYMAHMYRHRYVGTEHLLAGMLHVQDASLDTFFSSQNIDRSAIQDQLTLVFKSTSRFPEMEELLQDVSKKESPLTVPEPAFPILATEQVDDEDDEDETDEKGTPALDFFTRDLTESTIAETIDPVIGRQKEIERVMEILCRRTKNNPILTGEPGVGKTAIVEGLAKRMALGDVPPALKRKRILALDLAAVIAGTVYRGEFEGRIKQIIDETRSNSDIILFIDELHTIMGTGAASGSLDAANMLKPALARGDIRCIGATTPAEFKKHIEPDAALERRFQRVLVEEPSVETSLEILQGLAPYYERYHHVTIDPSAIEAAVRLSERYISDRFLPDKAIDLIDEAAAALRVHTIQEEGAEDARHQLEVLLEDVRKEKRESIIEERFEDALRLKERERSLKEELRQSKDAEPAANIGTIDASNIAAVVSRSTGIPVHDLAGEERKRLKSLEKSLRKTIIGQDHVTDIVASALLRSKTGIAPPHRPQASFLFVGPSGVGKTALARTLAQELFQDKDALIHLDMSEYSEGFTISKLIGSPAGYVGYREGAKLTDQVKQKPYAVVLFDEIEKAHRDTQALLLQILETGTLDDATGKSISFKQTVIVMTSNVGLERFGGSSLGFHEGANHHQELSSGIHQDLKERFRPELLNRIDQILLFHPLGIDALEKIAEQHLLEVLERLKEKGIHLNIDDDVPRFIAESAQSETIGARAIRRYIQDHVETALAKKLLGSRSPKNLHLKRQGKRLVTIHK